MSTVLVYSDDPAVRERVRIAVGRRPEPSLDPIDWLEADDGGALVTRVDEGGVDVCVLDGEAAPEGGMGLSRQLKNEIADCPAILLLVMRRDDRWLARWSLADAVVAHADRSRRAHRRARRTAARARRSRCRRPRRVDELARASLDRGSREHLDLPAPPSSDLAGADRPADGGRRAACRRNRLGDGRDHGRRRERRAGRRRSSSPCAARVRRRPRSTASSARCSNARVPLPLAEPLARVGRRHLRHRRRPRRHGQHLDDGGDHRRRCRRAGRQARQPGGHLASRVRRSAGGARRRDRPRAGRRRPLRRAGRHRLLLRAALPSGAASCGRPARRDRGADGLQRARPARPTRRASPGRPSASRSSGSARCSPGCWPAAARRRWSFAATTGSTS